MKKLNIGCGLDIKKGYINLDYIANSGVDVVANLDKRLPFKDNSIDVIRAAGVLEHCRDWLSTMNEIYRIMKNEGIIYISVPHFSCAGAYDEPTHRHFFGWRTFNFLCNEYKMKSGKRHSNLEYYGEKKWMLKRRYLSFTTGRFKFLNTIINPIINRIPYLYERMGCWLLPVEELKFELVKETK